MCLTVAEVVVTTAIIHMAYGHFISLTSSCVGFHFLGITLILIVVASVIRVIIGCATAGKLDEECTEIIRACCTFSLAVLLLALGIFAVVVSSQGGGKAVPGRSYKEYEVESYSKWMQNKIHANWDNYYKKAVLKNKEFVCARYDDYIDQPIHKVRAASAFKSGCCDAPRGCKLCSFNNQTSSQRSIKLENGGHCSDDCNRWDNDPNTLCFDCQSCKAGFLEDLTKAWLRSGVELIILAITLLGVQLKSIF